MIRLRKFKKDWVYTLKSADKPIKQFLKHPIIVGGIVINKYSFRRQAQHEDVTQSINK